MTSAVFFPPASGRRQALSAIAYSLVLLGTIGSGYAMAAALLADGARVALLRDRAIQLSDRTNPRADAATARGAAFVGSPFLEGQTATLAGAALQQHIEQAITEAGGALSSSQIDLDGPESKNRFLSLTVSLQIAQPALQSLLYDLEAGLPYLFVNSFEAQAAEAFSESGDGRMRVTMSVSGLWEPAP